MHKLLVFLLLIGSPLFALPTNADETQRYRVIISTDIGGTDPDDFQSMVHLLLYADSFDIEGLISSPFGPGRKQHILEVIDLYERDYESLRGYSDDYPTPDTLRSVTRQGEVDVAPYRGFRQPTEGSKWIIERARADDSRPLHILIWGGIEDLAQALHDAPDILPSLRVYWIGGPNKKWSPDAYQYIVTHHPELQIIESNATYRGWFVGGNQQGEWGNQGFVESHIAGHGALGDFFATQLGGTIKMGDTPSVGWLLKGTPEDPSQPGWGGRFVRAWSRPHKVFDRLTTLDDEIEEFGIFELVLPLGVDAPDQPDAQMLIENQTLNGFVDADSNVRFRFCPKGAKKFSYTIRSNAPSLDGKAGELTAMPISPNVALEPDEHWPNWWADNPRPEFAEGPHVGAKSVSRWREDYLGDFSKRISRVSVTRIMPLGDSITYDNRRKDMRPTGVRIAYRRTLHDLLKSAGYAFDFVGSEDGGVRYLGEEMDDNAGFPGITDEQLAVLISTGFAGHTSTQVTPGPYLEANPADIILLHIGTNHVEASPDDVEQILDNIRSSDADVYIIVARIINRYPYDEVTTAFNDNVEAMVTARADSRIIMVDMEDGAGIDYYTDMDDDLHPNYLGYNKMAAVWFEALSELQSRPEFKK